MREVSGYYGAVTRRIISASEKATNVQNGLTPTGLIRQPGLRKAKPGQIDSKHKVPVGRGRTKTNKPAFPPGDYRSQGKAFTVGRKNHYLRIVRETGEEAIARADVGVSYGTVCDHMTKDKDFQEGVSEALRQHASVYAKEMKRRGVDGYQEPVFGNQGPGAGSGIVGWVTRYSDRLLLEQARKFDPKYTPTSIVKQTTTVKGLPSLGLDKLSAESREDLRRILEREQCTDEPEPDSIQEG